MNPLLKYSINYYNRDTQPHLSSYRMGEGGKGAPTYSRVQKFCPRHPMLGTIVFVYLIMMIVGPSMGLSGQ